MQTKNTIKWFFENGMYTFGCDTPADFILKLSLWNMKDCVADIQCKTLVCDGDDEMDVLKGQASLLYKAMNCQKDFFVFKKEDGCGSHCQMGGRIQSCHEIYNWVDTQIKNKN